VSSNMFEGKGVIVREIGVAGSNPACPKFRFYSLFKILSVFGSNPRQYTRQ